ncbi:MAG: hypothetical protein WBM63_18735, partial [Sedimenticolaceae bacterium]
PLKAGTVDDFNSSMAEAMEQALAQEYQKLKNEGLPDMGEDDRRMLFAAIAQGVVRHLKDNLTAFAISVETTQVTGEAGAPLMRSDNPAGIAVSGGGSIAAGAADVVQVDTADNRIKSRGDAVLQAIQTEGVLY